MEGVIKKTSKLVFQNSLRRSEFFFKPRPHFQFLTHFSLTNDEYKTLQTTDLQFNKENQTLIYTKSSRTTRNSTKSPVTVESEDKTDMIVDPTFLKIYEKFLKMRDKCLPSSTFSKNLFFQPISNCYKLITTNTNNNNHLSHESSYDQIDSIFDTSNKMKKILLPMKDSDRWFTCCKLSAFEDFEEILFESSKFAKLHHDYGVENVKSTEPSLESIGKCYSEILFPELNKSRSASPVKSVTESNKITAAKEPESEKLELEESPPKTPEPKEEKPPKPIIKKPENKVITLNPDRKTSTETESSSTTNTTTATYSSTSKSHPIEYNSPSSRAICKSPILHKPNPDSLTNSPTKSSLPKRINPNTLTDRNLRRSKRLKLCDNSYDYSDYNEILDPILNGQLAFSDENDSGENNEEQTLTKPDNDNKNSSSNNNKKSIGNPLTLNPTKPPPASLNGVVTRRSGLRSSDSHEPLQSSQPKPKQVVSLNASPPSNQQTLQSLNQENQKNIKLLSNQLNKQDNNINKIMSNQNKILENQNKINNYFESFNTRLCKIEKILPRLERTCKKKGKRKAIVKTGRVCIDWFKVVDNQKNRKRSMKNRTKNKVQTSLKISKDVTKSQSCHATLDSHNNYNGDIMNDSDNDHAEETTQNEIDVNKEKNSNSLNSNSKVQNGYYSSSSKSKSKK